MNMLKKNMKKIKQKCSLSTKVEYKKPSVFFALGPLKK